MCTSYGTRYGGRVAIKFKKFISKEKLKNVDGVKNKTQKQTESAQVTNAGLDNGTQ
ncbi:MAG: hypothetical protein CM15mV38_0410 [uncultured marine virus]|nr:MAG: hypothetical protein CM15mV38_0410 [uncultured marine virus]